MICAALLATVAFLATATQETTEVQAQSGSFFLVAKGDSDRNGTPVEASDPWDERNIYLHLAHEIFQPNVAK